MDDITIGLEARVEDALTVEVQELERELRLQPNITQAEKETAIAELRDEIEAKILDEQKVDRFIVKYKTGHETSFLQKTQTAEHIELVEAINGGILNFWQPTQGDIELITLPEKVNPAEYAAELSEIGADADIEYIQPDYKLEFAALDGLTDEWAQESDEQAQLTNEQESDESLESIDESSESIAEESTETAELGAPENAVIVALIDTGVDITHPDLAGKFWNNGTYSAEDDTLLYGWNFIDDNAVVYDEDLGLDQAHGTHIAGIIAGLSDADDALTANRDSVRLMVLKAFEGGSAYTSDIIEAITFADTGGAQIINCSWGSTAGH
jgi:subtilisin family serine protease